MVFGPQRERQTVVHPGEARPQRDPAATAGIAGPVQPTASRSQTGAPQSEAEHRQPNPLVPSLALPRAGGAIQGLGEKFAANPLTGVPSLTVPIYTSPGRSGFGPQLAVSYQPGAGNGPFGLEWALSVPAITRKTEKGLPRYDDPDGSDTFLLSQAEDLVAALRLDTTSLWVADTTTIGQFAVRRYRPRVEGLFARIERLEHMVTGDVFWRATTKDNITSIYGQSPDRRITDPADPTRVFSWLLEATYDDKGNAVLYEYKSEDLAGIDQSAASEAHRRNGAARIANRYLKQIHYGNTRAYVPDPNLAITPAQALQVDPGWLFHVIFDYGEHDPSNPAMTEVQPWLVRRDPFSNYRAGFELRTYRLCQRVLMFHTIQELDAQPYLIHSTNFTYTPSPVLTQLVSVTSTGYLKDTQTGAYQRASLPSLDFTYTEATLDPNVYISDATSMENLPSGLDGTRYEWVDLDSEGLSGVLTEQAGTWFYKRNLGQGALAPLEVVATLPSLANLSGGRQQLLDLASNGHKSLVELSRPVSGYYGRTQPAGVPNARWDVFIPFSACPNINWQDPNLRMIDLDGDGRADVLITEDELFIWYPSLAEDGFGQAEWVRKPFDDAKGPALVFADGTQSIFLTDMSGDGLTDLVRIRNGEVSYWPNLGYGRFGPRVVMDAPPVFDYEDQFDQRRVRLADIDGSGTTDLVYLGRDEIRYWLNQSGNGWGQPQSLQQFPATDDLLTVMVVDLLGTGTSCIVWSSPRPGDARQPMHYIDLMCGTDWSGAVVHGYKPYLLSSVTNNLGAETRIQYAPSTQFYVQDRAQGTPWITRIPFPVQVVTQIESRDAVSDSKLVTRYAYHHGYYDADEREFRGFGMVEQWDTQSYADYVGAGLFDKAPAGVEADLHLPPVHTKTWHHTGAIRDRDTIVQLLQQEYYRGDPLAALLPDTQAPEGLSPQEERECCRALKGMVLRQEIYADDGTSNAGDPFTVSEHRYAVRRIQPVSDNRHAVVLAHALESIDYHYERNPQDPRIGHQMTLAVDAFGQVTKSVAVGYPRRAVPPAPPNLSEQGQLFIAYSESDLINKPDEANYYRLGVPAESRSYEVTGLTPANGVRFTWDELRVGIASAPVIAYEVTPTPASGAQKRLLKQARSLYYADDLSGALALGQVESRALPHTQYQLAFSPTLRQTVFGSRVADPMLRTEGAYMQGSDLVTAGLFPASDDGTLWWTRSGRQIVDPAQFYLPTSAIDSFGNTSAITYDAHTLLVTQVTDPLKNVVQATHDYRLLRPWQVTDPNGNMGGAQSDVLGMVVASWETGKNGEGSTESDPSRTLDYDLFNWATNGQPNYVHTRERETYDASTRWLETFSYSDGFGRTIQAKVEAEPGLAPARDGQGVLQAGQMVDTTPNPRWVGTGRTIFDNKGNPVKQYEPFFSADAGYETEAQLVQVGVTPVLRYDALSRLIRTDLPDGSFSKVAFDPWQQRAWDPNDTVNESQWSTQHTVPAWLSAHANTPAVTHLDTLGRAVLTIADNGAAGQYATRVKLDIEGKQLAVIDARGNTAQATDYDQLGRALHTTSPDAGERWMLADVAGAPMRGWDSRGVAQQTTYDALRRPTGLTVTLGATTWLAEQTIYGEQAPSSANALASNLMGRVYQHFDAAGIVTNISFDFKGNLLQGSRQLLRDLPNPVDWSQAQTLGEAFAASTAYDALNRPTTSTAPDGSVVFSAYNEARLLETVKVQLAGAIAATPYVTTIDYDAKGQRTRIAYGNGARTDYTYDPATFRLTRLMTMRPSGSNPLQDLSYTYDPVGNIASITDSSQETVYINNQAVKPNATCAYDPLYRLIQATGREHQAQYSASTTNPIPCNEYDPSDAQRCNLTNPSDLQAMQTYTESYTYDAVGNILHMQHAAGNGGWTRAYTYAAQSNRLLSTTVPLLPGGVGTYSYDAHGNMTQMPHLPVMAWTFKNELQQVTLPGTGGSATYVYDAAGQRVRKVWAHGVIEERIYLGGYERYRRWSGSGALQTQRYSLHIMDGAQRICLVETTTVDTSLPASELPATTIRYQLGNHLGSAVLELDENAAIISYEEYYPHGSTSYQAGASAAETSLKRYRYTGKERDEESGLYYHGARYYAPWLGRWTSADPAGMVDGTNLYTYVRDEPIARVDPSGYQEQPRVAASMDRDDPLSYATFEEFAANATGPWSPESLREQWDEAHPDELAGQQTGSMENGAPFSAFKPPDDRSIGNPVPNPASAHTGASTTVAPMHPENANAKFPTNEDTSQYLAILTILNARLTSNGRGGELLKMAIKVLRTDVRLDGNLGSGQDFPDALVGTVGEFGGREFASKGLKAMTTAGKTTGKWDLAIRLVSAGLTLGADGSKSPGLHAASDFASIVSSATPTSFIGQLGMTVPTLAVDAFRGTEKLNQDVKSIEQGQASAPLQGLVLAPGLLIDLFGGGGGAAWLRAAAKGGSNSAAARVGNWLGDKAYELFNRPDVDVYMWALLPFKQILGLH
jgi:RHS repeat-associated protein